MKTNTNTDLREQVAEHLRLGYHETAETKVVNSLMHLIDQYVHQKQVEAKTDELLLAGKNYDGPRFAEYIDSRIASLNTEGEK